MIVLACTPACSKKQSKQTTSQEDINTTIELENSIFEAENIEEDINDAEVVKF